jgi:hypothetical protein
MKNLIDAYHSKCKEVTFQIGTKGTREKGVNKKGHYVDLEIEKTNSGYLKIKNAVVKGYDEVIELLDSAIATNSGVLTVGNVIRLDELAENENFYRIIIKKAEES